MDQTRTHAGPVIDRRIAGAGLLATAALPWTGAIAATSPLVFDVRRFGARGDGKAIDSDAINRAIVAANRAGGGTVVVPPGKYLCFSIRLQSDVTLLLSPGSTIIAADPVAHRGRYDEPENDLEVQYQDFGITHSHNSLIYGDGVTNVAIIGGGLIHGLGLDREAGAGDRWHNQPGFRTPAEQGLTPKQVRLANPKDLAAVGRGNKSIALVRCRNVLLRDFTILQGGHFGVIAHGVVNMTIDNLVIDTDRDGIDIDCCRDVRVRGCTVNAAKDDAIVIKSSYALGKPVISEDISITGCKVMGYRLGALLDGTYEKSDYLAGRGGVLGRIKLGTESNGGFRNILISDCIVENARGILMGIVDGGTLEDVVVSDITMRNPLNHPLFVHLSARMRTPPGTPLGQIRRVRFENINVSGTDMRYPCGVAGLPDAYIEDVSFRGIHVASPGGGTAADAAIDPPQDRKQSLEVMFMKTLPATGFYGRHARRLTLRDMEFTVDRPDARPTVAFHSVDGAIVDDLVSPSPRTDAVVSRDSKGIAIGDVRTFG